ncbi:endonuclease/exonuclease/phosphatase family protein [Galbitalea sp. SE-J8]|uniref:endonuclease/exonuclease/phosphatase family protein n=1 Tax=Galbitalea sp. SE-J8 TaxID=3054952 RepID=UPI00259C9161|nr:endonuclease/exonuclease/phosphatase family protein [Galbitalea sp. SE-J8]MDM4764241.1 endonuclease/exonuclease/phosphatase family protein [Galbitalea sp. SE-J8]
MIRRLLDAIVPVVLAAALLVVAWPGVVHLERAPVVAQVASFRAAAAAAGVALLVLALLVVALRRRSRRLAASVALVCAAFVGLQAIVVTDRGTGGDPAARHGDGPAATAGDGDLTVLSWNTLGGAPGAQAVADLVETERADVVTLPETTEEFGAEVAGLLAARGTTMQVLSTAFDHVSKARSTTLLVGADLGEYRLDDAAGSTGQLPSVVAGPAAGGGPTLVAVHAVAPVPSELATWRSDLDWAAATCRGDTIMAGDFNSTLDHWTHEPHGAGAGLGSCRDAAQRRDAAAVGTWPTWAPALVGTPIDHVLATPQWTPVAFRVITTLDGAGSDHRPIVATLRPASGRPTGDDG